MREPRNANLIAKILANPGRTINMYPGIFIILPFPYQDPKTNIWTREYGEYDLTFIAGKDAKIPSGKYARLLMSHIATQFKLNYRDTHDDERKRTVMLGTKTDLSREFGLGTLHGGQGGGGTLIYNAMVNIASLAISTRSNHVRAKHRGIIIENLLVADKLQLFWDTEKRDQSTLFTNYIVLSHNFAQLLLFNSVPIDWSIYKKLPTARHQDIYAWLIRRFKTVKREELIPYDLILPQFFDSVYRRVKPRLKDELKRYLLELKEFYPEANVRSCEKGLVLSPSRLHIDPTNLAYI